MSFVPFVSVVQQQHMPILHAIVLGIVQGLSEFLPISSSGHLILVPKLFHWTELTCKGCESLNKTYDVALHIGTLVGAVAYFWRDIVRLVGAALTSIRQRAIETDDQRIVWLLVVSSIPGAAIGAVAESVIDKHLGIPWLIGVMLVVFGLVLYWADQRKGEREEHEWGVKDAVLMGAAQACALSPGVSRSGATISMARGIGFTRDSAARLSFLMSLPITGGAVLFKSAKLFAGDGIPPGFRAAFVWGILASAITGFAAVFFILKLIRTRTFRPFVIYRVVAGLAVIVIFGTGLR